MEEEQDPFQKMAEKHKSKKRAKHIKKIFAAFADEFRKLMEEEHAEENIKKLQDQLKEIALNRKYSKRLSPENCRSNRKGQHLW